MRSAERVACDAGPIIALIGLVVGVGAVVFFPFFYGVIGAVSGLIFSGLYNLVAKATGGIELDID